MLIFSNMQRIIKVCLKDSTPNFQTKNLLLLIKKVPEKTKIYGNMEYESFAALCRLNRTSD